MPLSHLRVLDLTHYRAGPYCTRLFAGFGADVIKIERPGAGDPLRRCGPYLDDKADLERSIPFHWLNCGKRSLVLDLLEEEGRAVLLELARQADVLVENFSPGVMRRLGLGTEVLQAVNPHLVTTSITNFGASGPYKDFKADEIVLYAMSGGMVATGDADKPPLAPGPAVTQYTAGLHAFVGALIGLFRRDIDGSAQPVEVSIQESALENVEIHLAEFAHEGKVACRNGDTHPLVPWQCYPCRDGYAAVVGGPLRHWPKAARALFGESGLGGKDFNHVGQRIARRKEVEDLVCTWLASRDKVDVYHAGQKQGLAFGYLATLADALSWQQHKERGFFWKTEPHPDVGELTAPGPLFRIGHPTWNMGRAPRLGEHTSEVLGEWLKPGDDDKRPLGAGAGRSGKATGKRASAGQPLQGVRIIEITHEWAGPHAGRTLADFGAEVIKVEYYRRIDHMRGARIQDRIFDKHARFRQLNRNKRSLALDLKDAADRSVFADLVRRSDVVLTNSRVGALDRLGFGYENLRQLKGDIILVAMSSHGQTGPEALYCGYGGGIEATSGIQSLTGYGADTPPRRIREMDVLNGIAGAAAIMTALVARQKSGHGAFIDLSEHEVPLHVLAGEHAMAQSANGTSGLPRGNRNPERAPQGCYPCKGDDAWIAISIGSDQEWQALCTVTGHPEWARDPRFADRQGRAEHHDELDRLVSTWTEARTPEAAMGALQTAGVPAGAVLNAAALHADPHLEERSYFQMPRQEPEAPRFSGFPFRLGNGGAVIRRGGPPLGEANREIIVGLLGRAEEEVRSLDINAVGTDFDVEGGGWGRDVAASGSPPSAGAPRRDRGSDG